LAKRDEPGAFDERYYRRFYGTKRTRIQGEAEVAHLGGALVELTSWYGAPVRSVLEVGAGVGLLRDWFLRHHPKVSYVSTEYSAYAAETYAHTQRDIATWRTRRRFDLVVCQGVLPYLSDRDAARAIENLAAMSRGFCYLEAITRHDYDTACDQVRTDPSMRLRPAAFYRTRLGRHYRPLGGGLYYVKTGPLVFWELETLPVTPVRRARRT
jgi:hypothetical protein